MAADGAAQNAQKGSQAEIGQPALQRALMERKGGARIVSVDPVVDVWRARRKLQVLAETFESAKPQIEAILRDEG
jgi:hypothetical protein